MSLTSRILLAALMLLAACAAPPAPTPTAIPGTTPVPTSTTTPVSAVSHLPSPVASPTITPTPTQTTCMERTGATVRYAIATEFLSRPLNYTVYTPPCYDDSGETRYPVLYMLHGQTYTDDQWVRLGLTRSADWLINSRTAQPFLIVLPYEIDAWADPYRDGYPQAITQTLIPHIDEAFPTCAERACRAVGGLSRGGAYAYLLALDYPALFGSAGGHSMVPFGGMTTRLPQQMRATLIEDFPRLWIDTGEGDYYLNSLLPYEKLLTDQGIPHEFTLFPGGHTEEYWAGHVEEYLRWYVEGFEGGHS